ncbi:MAG: class I SAM-dependent methyltransferase [Chloroflexi bacterium]|nr:class I SAM-dependent methyltransferase [Chloroflexota bacterium]
MAPGDKPPLSWEASSVVQRFYNRAASGYDAMESFMQKIAFRSWRSLLWSNVRGPAVLEVGAGTGANFRHYPEGLRVVAVDLSPNMLRRARVKATRGSVNVDLILMDAQSLALRESVFDCVVTSFVFCSVPDPLLGLAELRRVCKTGASIFMLEHVRSANRVIGRVMDLMNPVAVRIGGENINRNTVDNVACSGLLLDKVTDLWGGVFKLIQATKGQAPPLEQQEVRL